MLLRLPSTAGPAGPTPEELAAREARRAARAEELRRRGREQARQRREKLLEEKAAYLEFLLRVRARVDELKAAAAAAAEGGGAAGEGGAVDEGALREVLDEGQFEDEAELEHWLGERR